MGLWDAKYTNMKEEKIEISERHHRLIVKISEVETRILRVQKKVKSGDELVKYEQDQKTLSKYMVELTAIIEERRKNAAKLKTYNKEQNRQLELRFIDFM